MESVPVKKSEEWAHELKSASNSNYHYIPESVLLSPKVQSKQTWDQKVYLWCR
jgi:hypothetical protein